MIVFNCGIDPNYFYDEMTGEEVQAVIENYNISYQNQWNQIRWLGYINCICVGNKITNPKDLMLFSWEQEQLEENNIEDQETTKDRLLKILESV